MRYINRISSIILITLLLAVSAATTARAGRRYITPSYRRRVSHTGRVKKLGSSLSKTNSTGRLTHRTLKKRHLETKAGIDARKSAEQKRRHLETKAGIDTGKSAELKKKKEKNTEDLEKEIWSD